MTGYTSQEEADHGRFLETRFSEDRRRRGRRKLGYASDRAIADFIIVDMVAEAASGDKTPQQAAERAATPAQRYYKV
jgi:hypothetical protein